MTLKQIIKAFINHTQEVNGRYGLSIRDGALVYDYMATGCRGFYSATTSKHVGMIKRAVPHNCLELR